MVIFTKEGMDAYEPVLVVNIPPVRFLGGPKNKGRTGKKCDPGTQKYWWL